MSASQKTAYHILVVDDESSVCKAIKMLLEFDGHTVETADSGEKALELFVKSKYNLIITDYSMGGMKGDHLAARIKQSDPQQPIILATAFAESFRNSGQPTVAVDAVINKPFSLLELREAVSQVAK